MGPAWRFLLALQQRMNVRISSERKAKVNDKNKNCLRSTYLSRSLSKLFVGNIRIEDLTIITFPDMKGYASGDPFGYLHWKIQ